MNPEPQTNTTPELTVLNSPGPETGHSTSPANGSSPSTINHQPSTNKLHRKIAKLPKALRDRINAMMDDSHPYPEIVIRLQQSADPPLPYPISEMDLSRWKAGGYQRHLAEQERIESLRADREAALEMVATDDTTTLPEATLQIIASQYYRFLGDFNPESLKEKLAEDPLKYTRFLNVFARLVREIVNLKKHRQDSARAAATQLKQLDQDRDLAGEELRLIVDKMDRVFKVARPEFARHSLSGPPPPQPARPPHSPQARQPASLAVPKLERSSGADEASTLDFRRRGNESLTSGDNSGGSTQPPDSLQPAACNLQPQSHSFPSLNPQLPTLSSPPIIPPAPPLTEHESRSTADGRLCSGAGVPPVSLTEHQSRSTADGLARQSEAAAGTYDTQSASPTHSPTGPLVAPESGDGGPAHSSTLPAAREVGPELCPRCDKELPPLKPDGHRPRSNCWSCGGFLLEPNTELCPGCRHALPPPADGTRPFTDCRRCGFDLPPPGQNPLIFTSYRSGPRPP